MAHSENRPRRRQGSAVTVLAYVLGLVGIGTLVATLILLYQFDQRQQQREQQLQSVEGKMASVQGELGKQKQDNSVLSNRIADLEDQLRGRTDATGRLITDVREGDAPLADDLEALREQLKQDQARLADLEARSRDFQKLASDAEQMEQLVNQLRQQLAEMETLTGKYASLKQEFDSQAKQLLATNEDLRSLQKQVAEDDSRQTVLRSTAGSPAPATTMTTTSLPELTSFPPAGTTITTRYPSAEPTTAIPYSQSYSPAPYSTSPYSTSPYSTSPRIITSYPPSTVVYPPSSRSSYFWP